MHFLAKLNEFQLASGNPYPNKTIKIWRFDTGECIKALDNNNNYFGAMRIVKLNEAQIASVVSWGQINIIDF